MPWNLDISLLTWDLSKKTPSEQQLNNLAHRMGAGTAHEPDLLVVGFQNTKGGSARFQVHGYQTTVACEESSQSLQILLRDGCGIDVDTDAELRHLVTPATQSLFKKKIVTGGIGARLNLIRNNVEYAITFITSYFGYDSSRDTTIRELLSLAGYPLPQNGRGQGQETPEAIFFMGNFNHRLSGEVGQQHTGNNRLNPNTRVDDLVNMLLGDRNDLAQSDAMRTSSLPVLYAFLPPVPGDPNDNLRPYLPTYRLRECAERLRLDEPNGQTLEKLKSVYQLGNFFSAKSQVFDFGWPDRIFYWKSSDTTDIALTAHKSLPEVTHTPHAPVLMRSTITFP